MSIQTRLVLPQAMNQNSRPPKERKLLSQKFGKLQNCVKIMPRHRCRGLAVAKAASVVAKRGGAVHRLRGTVRRGREKRAGREVKQNAARLAGCRSFSDTGENRKRAETAKAVAAKEGGEEKTSLLVVEDYVTTSLPLASSP